MPQDPIRCLSLWLKGVDTPIEGGKGLLDDLAVVGFYPVGMDLKTCYCHSKIQKIDCYIRMIET